MRSGLSWMASLLSCLLLAASATPHPPATPTVAIVGATVVPMDREVRLPDHTVIVADGTIQWVGPDDEASIPADATRIDGRGRYLFPGLADMHVHSDESSLALLLANGVTTARELNGSDDHIRWRDEIAAGKRRGPRLFVSSTLLTGESFPVRHIVVTEPGQGRDLVRRFAAGGYDLIKIYDGLSPAVYDAIIREARSVGLPITGHIPQAVGLEGVLRAGQSIEHTEKIVFDTMGHDFDESRLPSIAAEIADAGVWVTPTLASQRALAMAGTPAYTEALQRPDIVYVSAGTRAWWATLAPGGSGVAGDHPRPGPEASPYYQIQRALVRALFDARVPMIAGSDCPNPLMVPGFALHDELAALVDAGLSPYDVARMATVNAAADVGHEAEFGVIAPGAAADLVLIDGDPLESVRALRHPDAVMVRGEWLGRVEIDRMLEEVARTMGEGS